MGIKRSLQQQQEADVVLFVIDAKAGLSNEDFKFLDFASSSQFFFVLNKSDLIDGDREVFANIEQQLRNKFPSLQGGFLVSALALEDREKLLSGLFSSLGILNFENDVLISQSRQYENLLVVEKNVSQALQQLESGIGSEFVAFELKEALMKLQEIIGVRFDDQIMDRVFKEFCIGK